MIVCRPEFNFIRFMMDLSIIVLHIHYFIEKYWENFSMLYYVNLKFPLWQL